MIVAELHFFQVKVELTAADAVVAFELSFRIAPEVLNPVDVITLALCKALLVIDAVMLEAIQPIIGAETIGI